MSVVHVAVAVIERAQGLSGESQIFISKRSERTHQGGLWEFPGGKVESGEDVITALARELDEELGIQIRKDSNELHPLIEIHHDYGDKKVFLDVWRLSEFTGKPHGREGQPVKWASLDELFDLDFPAANHPIINACRLPRLYAITPVYSSQEEALIGIEHLIGAGAKIILLRQPQLEAAAYLSWAKNICCLCREKQVKLLASGSASLLEFDYFDGLQLPWREAAELTSRPVSENALLGVSCHNDEELRHAEALNADFATLSPVQPTLSHPGVSPIGWQAFAATVKMATLPVYALGGIGLQDLKVAIGHGAQGIAGIRCWQA